MHKNPTLHLESAIPSYLTACPSRNLIVAEQAGEKHWTVDFIFENEWQIFHTKKYRGLKPKTPFHECNPGRYKIATKVGDLFSNDTMKIIGVSV